MVSREFLNERDSESQLAFGLDIQNIRQFANVFVGGETVTIPILDTDNYAIFFPTPGVNFTISDETPIPTIPAAVNDDPMSEVNVAQNVSLIKLTSWRSNSKNTIYITSALPQTIMVGIWS